MAKNNVEDYSYVYEDFLERVNNIVEEYLSANSGKAYHQFYEDKVINDPIWGCIKFNSCEIGIIDTPLFQRLRDIYQVGLAVFTYPSARHSRFEHSLGVVAMASRMIESLQKQTGHGLTITEHDILEVRLAALLHDIGHCFYSHLSETFYGEMPEFTKLKRFFNIKFSARPKQHEIFSFLIINTNSFKRFLSSTNLLSQDFINAFHTIDTLMERIGKMIIGVTNEANALQPKSKNIFFSN